MRFFGILGLLVAISLLTISCSDKKEEVAKLEKEVLDEGADIDSVGDSSALTDTLGVQTSSPQTVPDEVEPEPFPAIPTGGGYTVQVAGCESQAYAQHLVNVYQDRGYEPYVTNKTVEGQLYYRVRIGQFENLQEAKVLKADLLDKYSVEAWIDLIS